MPCKQEVLKYLDEISPAARLVGACNTIVNHDGVLTGYITDGEGYIENLRHEGVEVKGKKITLLGAGGVSSAIQAQALLDGAREIAVFNKKDAFWEKAIAKAAEYQKAFPSQKITVYDMDDAERLAAEIRATLSNAERVDAPGEYHIITDTPVPQGAGEVADVHPFGEYRRSGDAHLSDHLYTSLDMHL